MINDPRQNVLIDLTAPELKNYSLCRAIAEQASKKASLEREVSDEIGRKLKRDTGGIYFPTGLQMIPEGMRIINPTPYSATDPTAPLHGGGNLVANNMLYGRFIDVLRNKLRVGALGATILPGLVGNATIPRQETPAPAYWISPEGADVTEGEGTFDQVVLSPKTVGARSQYTRQLLLQASPEIELFVRNDLARVLATAIDLAAIAGTGATGGTGEPLGIVNAGVQTVALGANGGVLSIDALIALEGLLAAANVDESDMAYLTNPHEIGNLKELKDTSGRYLWTQYPGAAAQRSGVLGEINGYPVARSNQVPNTLTKGTGSGLSAVIMGLWSDLIIGEWGFLEILPNPYGAGFASGTIDIRALQSVDIQLRHLASFAAVVDAI
ncbi:MAG TPA: phage major capsid protein [Acidocella sp.]|nr:phage major capsid protein [Acidocella sp.]